MKKNIITLLVIFILGLFIYFKIQKSNILYQPTSLDKQIKLIEEKCNEKKNLYLNIVPQCYIKKSLKELNLSKQEVMTYCIREWNDCENNINNQLRIISGNYMGQCLSELVNIDDDMKYTKSCMLSKMINNHKVSTEKALSYCSDDLLFVKGTCSEAIDKIDEYEKIISK